MQGILAMSPGIGAEPVNEVRVVIPGVGSVADRRKLAGNSAFVQRCGLAIQEKCSMLDLAEWIRPAPWLRRSLAGLRKGGLKKSLSTRCSAWMTFYR